GEIVRPIKGEKVAARSEEGNFDPDMAIRPQDIAGFGVKPSAGLIGRAWSTAQVLVNPCHIVGGGSVIGGAPFLPKQRSRMRRNIVLDPIVIGATGRYAKRRCRGQKI